MPKGRWTLAVSLENYKRWPERSATTFTNGPDSPPSLVNRRAPLANERTAADFGRIRRRRSNIGSGSCMWISSRPWSTSSCAGFRYRGVSLWLRGTGRVEHALSNAGTRGVILWWLVHSSFARHVQPLLGTAASRPLDLAVGDELRGQPRRPRRSERESVAALGAGAAACIDRFLWTPDGKPDDLGYRRSTASCGRDAMVTGSC